MYLRQATASQVVKLGPFLDDTDGKTAETALTIANTDIKLTKAGSSEASKNSGGATHVANGRYYCTLDATDTSTVGLLEIDVHVSGALPVKQRFYVVEEAIYDAFYAASATGLLPANVTQWKGSTAPDMTGDAYARLGAPAGASVSADIAATKAQTAAIETDTQDLQTRLGTNGAGLTALPWNPAWDAEVESECTDALNAYDPPTKAEMDARTLAAASYATATAQATAQADLDLLTGTDGAILATSQPNYAPAKAGDQMDLVNVPNATAVSAVQSGLATATDLATVDTVVDASKVILDKLNTALELDGAVYRFTTNALEQAPTGTGGGGGDATAANQVQILADIATLQADVTAILDDTGTSGVVVASGSKSGYSLSQAFPANFASLAINASGHVVLQDASLVTAKLGTFTLAKGTNLTGLNDLDSAAVNAACDTALADYGGAKTTELNALQSHGDLAWATASGFSTHSAMDVAALVLATPANKLATDSSGRVEVSGTITTLDALDTAQDAQHAATQAKTNNLPASPAATGDIPSAASVAAAALTTQMVESYRATGQVPTLAQAILELLAHMGNASIAGTTKTLKKLDKSTTAKTYTLNDADNPSSVEEAS